MNYLIVILFIVLGSDVVAQNDTINQVDKDGLKQGYWIEYGVDRPEYGYPDSAIYKEGRYLDDRKEGLWTKYDRDGTVLITIVFKNGFPYSETGFREFLKYGYSRCEKSLYDSFQVRYRNINMVGPLIDTIIVFYPNSGELAAYVDSLSIIDTAYQSNQMVFCSHFRDITI